mmetsp:Transcript_12211/g.33888  ORF Transcript_12211/g.33888 Transcript_12211/m.33888 type:complete len:198 (-) Transcript_12211:223-816(-)|eukprot:CAMPEP_0168721950 /NCGR_PEP_ID=MMETSP0724-20121128/2349_1 /TAXON_ID=265536 /ORGANISM="Amphiprora sp., Strain CCMP467" /LENGTH=197 /DNA_ID=CAMNT_0008768613 /DNA_START=93 /DNA_END=686 /DNA_ORIENTATION=+
MGNYYGVPRSRAPGPLSVNKKSIDPHHRHQEELKREEELYQRIEQDRREGRSLLRQMDPKSDDEDWAAVINKVNSKKKNLLKKIERQERRLRRQKKRQRRKADAAGSFSINLLTLKQSLDMESPPVPGTFDANLVSIDSRGRKSTTCKSVLRWKQSVVPIKRHRSDATAPSIAEDENGCAILEEEDIKVQVIQATMG